MPSDHDTVIADLKHDVASFCEENEARYPVDEARGSNRKAP